MPAATKTKKRRNYRDSRWQFWEVYSKFLPSVRVQAVSIKQAKERAKQKLRKKSLLGSTGWLEVTSVRIVHAFRVTYRAPDGTIVETHASGINEVDARFNLAKRLCPQIPDVLSVKYVSSLRSYNKSKNIKGVYAPEEETGNEQDHCPPRPHKKRLPPPKKQTRRWWMDYD